MGENTKKAQPKQKEYADKRRQAKEKKVKEGDEVLLKREKSTTKSPWDPKPFKVVQVDGSKVTARRGDEKKARAKNHVKVVKIRPDYLRVKSKHQTKSRQEEELDLEVSEDTLERMRAILPADPGQGALEEGPQGQREDQVHRQALHLDLVPMQAEIEAQRRDRSISASGRVSRPPLRYGFETARAAENLQEGLTAYPEDNVVRVVTPCVTPGVSPDCSLGEMVTPEENSGSSGSTPVPSPSRAGVLSAPWLPSHEIAQGRTARERAQDILERHRHWSTSGEGIPNHPRFDQWQPGKVGGQVVEDVSSSGALKEERSGRDTLSPRKRKRRTGLKIAR